MNKSPGERGPIARGLWFCGSLLWASAAAIAIAAVGMIYVAGYKNVPLGIEFWVWIVVGILSAIVSGYMLKGFALLVGKAE